MVRSLDNAEAEAIGSSPEEFRAFVQDQIACFRELSKHRTIRME
jgi:hypothetical protein